MGIAGCNLTVILASRYISIEFQSNVILRLIWKISGVNANEIYYFYEQFVDKFDTPKNSKLTKISISLSILDGFQRMRAQKLS